MLMVLAIHLGNSLLTSSVVIKNIKNKCLKASSGEIIGPFGRA